MIYFDNNATTPLDPKVLAAVLPLMEDFVGNPSSIHHYGQKARALLTEGVRRCALYFGVRVDEIVFTSGASEALNFLIHSLPKKSHAITSSLEHAAVIEALKAADVTVTYLDPEPGKGAISADQVCQAIQENTRMIIVSSANNETGIKTPLDAIALVAEGANIPLIVDGVASLGKESFSIPKGVSAICFSGHKIHGPLGIGLAVVKKQFKARPLIHGGPQQRGLRAGTENLPAVVGFVEALNLLDTGSILHMTTLRDRFEEGLLQLFPDLIIHGQNEARICNTSNVAFPGIDGETLLMALDLAGVAASHGSACSSGTIQTSRVLLSMGIAPSIARTSLRFSFSRFNTMQEVERSLTIIASTLSHLKSRQAI